MQLALHWCWIGDQVIDGIWLEGKGFLCWETPNTKVGLACDEDRDKFVMMFRPQADGDQVVPSARLLG